jgi:hypothetical protein
MLHRTTIACERLREASRAMGRRGVTARCARIDSSFRIGASRHRATL